MRRGHGVEREKKDIGMADERRKDRENRNRTEEMNGKLFLPPAAQVSVRYDAALGRVN